MASVKFRARDTLMARHRGGRGPRTSDPIDDYLDFRRELREALRELSPSHLRAVVRRWAGPRETTLHRLAALSDGLLAPIIRKMILEEPQLVELHDSARLWLLVHEAAPIRARVIAATDHRRGLRPKRGNQ